MSERGTNNNLHYHVSLGHLSFLMKRNRNEAPSLGMKLNELGYLCAEDMYRQTFEY